MPRRLGDDPLARAKAAKAPQAEPALQASANAAPSAAPTSNDVFFQRRTGEEPAQPSASEERPEISEISQLPEIKDAAQGHAAVVAEVAATTTEPDAGVVAPSAPPQAGGSQSATVTLPDASASGFFKRIFDKFM